MYICHMTMVVINKDKCINTYFTIWMFINGNYVPYITTSPMEYIQCNSRHEVVTKHQHKYTPGKEQYKKYVYGRYKETCESWWIVDKGLEGLTYDEPCIGEAQAWVLALRDLCDREGQVDDWIRWIKLTMENHMFLSVNYCWIKKMRWHR
jgi:hypothetical protein